MQHEYLLLFGGMLFGGETVLLPAIYLFLIGKLHFLPLVATAVLATMMADSGWYLLGRFCPIDKLRLFHRGRSGRAFARTAELFKRHGLKVVFCSKFVYGTRIATQILAGITRLPYQRYALVNTASIFTWLSCLLLIGFIVHTSAGAFNLRFHRAYLLFGLLVPVLLLWRWFGNHIVSRLLCLPAHAERVPIAVPQKSVSAIIPAFNEAETVANVIRTLETHPAIDDIIVVDDGSTDDTGARVGATSATLISFPANRGKAAAMAQGVQRARQETIFFLDADLRGLTHEVIDALVSPVLSDDYDMFVAIRDRRQLLLNKIVYFAPILGGERVLKRQLWDQVPRWCVHSFQIEIALNYFSKRAGSRMGFALMPRLMHIKKEAKRGFWPGVRARASMYAELLSISFRLYILRSLLNVTPQNPRRQPAYPRP